MNKRYRLLLLEDEPLILMDLEFAARDRGCEVLAAIDSEEALGYIEEAGEIDAAVLDVSLGKDRTCWPVACELRKRGVPFILHSGDLDRHDEKIREINAEIIAKPASADRVIAAAIVCAEGQDPDAIRIAAE